MADIPEDEEEQSEFDEALKIEEAINLENMEKDSVQDAASSEVETRLEGKWQLEFTDMVRNFLEFCLKISC